MNICSQQLPFIMGELQLLVYIDVLTLFLQPQKLSLILSYTDDTFYAHRKVKQVVLLSFSLP